MSGGVAHVCPDRLAWAAEEKDAVRVLLRKMNPSIQFAPSKAEIARRFGHLSRRTDA